MSEKNKTNDNIKDDEIRLVGTQIQFTESTMVSVLKESNYSPTNEQDHIDDPANDASSEHPDPNQRKKSKKGCVIMALVLIIIALICFFIFVMGNFFYAEPPSRVDASMARDTASSMTVQVDTLQADRQEMSASNEAPAKQGEMLVQDTLINDIPLTLFTMEGARMELCIGRPNANDPDLLFATQAADIRSDNGLPAGAFIHHGELIAKGHSKLGYCSIIGGSVTLGRAQDTPDFERAIEENGDFFRHYSLVSGGELIEIPVKGKALRKALCIMGDNLTVVICRDRESYHDFSQALVDMGCQEAIALVGGEALCYAYDATTDKVMMMGTPASQQTEYENYIVWRKN